MRVIRLLLKILFLLIFYAVPKAVAESNRYEELHFKNIDLSSWKMECLSRNIEVVITQYLKKQYSPLRTFGHFDHFLVKPLRSEPYATLKLPHENRRVLVPFYENARLIVLYNKSLKTEDLGLYTLSKGFQQADFGLCKQK